MIRELFKRMTWFKSLTRELPFLTIENWAYCYYKGWPKLLGFTMKNVVYYSKHNVVEVYRIKEEWNKFINNLTKFCIKKPKLMLKYLDELDRLDKQIVSLTDKKTRTKKQLREYVVEIKNMMNYYATIYLIKTYANYAITKEVDPELAKRAESLIHKAEWFSLSKSIWKNTANVLNLPLKTASMMSLKEIIKCIDTGYVDLELMENRYKKYLWSVKTRKFYYRKDADNYLKRIKIEKIRSSKLIKGTVASKGKVKGKVVIVLSTEDFHKIKKGHIVVTHMTTPWFTPFLHKAKAIVTDEGGVGTHAAIISRELKIPCIIGTKIATQVLKDDDEIEVDANNGIVKKI